MKNKKAKRESKKSKQKELTNIENEPFFYESPRKLNFEKYLDSWLKSKLSLHDEKNYTNKNSSVNSGKNKFKFSFSGSQNSQIPSLKAQKDVSWNWSYLQFKRNEIFGVPPMLKLAVNKYPRPLGGDITDFVPPKLYTDSIVSAEDIEIVESEETKDDSNQIGVVPLDGNDPYIYSTEVGVPPYSFLNSDHQYTK